MNSQLNRVVLFPKYENQAIEFAKALDLVWKQGGWTIYLDELFYLDKLGVRLFIERLLTQGRSKGISVVSGMQRPVSVTRFAIGESSHVVSFGLEGRDAKLLGEVASPKLSKVVQELPRHAFAWYNVPTRQFWKGKYQDLERRDNQPNKTEENKLVNGQSSAHGS